MEHFRYKIIVKLFEPQAFQTKENQKKLRKNKILLTMSRHRRNFMLERRT